MAEHPQQKIFPITNKDKAQHSIKISISRQTDLRSKGVNNKTPDAWKYPLKSGFVLPSQYNLSCLQKQQ